MAPKIRDTKHVKTTDLCFSTDDEWDEWMRYNCDKCIFSAKINAHGSYNKVDCPMQRDLFRQAIGQNLIMKRSYDITRHKECIGFKIRKRFVKTHVSKPEYTEELYNNLKYE